MPATPASAVAGPSRIPYNPQAMRRRTIAGGRTNHHESNDIDMESDDEEQDVLGPERVTPRKRLTSRARSVSFQPSEIDTSTPKRRSIQHRRTGSGGSQSHQSIYLSPPVKPKTLKVKRAIRQFLTGSAVLGMTINDRAEVFADVAGDCLVTLIQAAFKAEAGKRRSIGYEDEVKKAWQGLHALRHSYFFPTYSPPFPLLSTILESLHSHVRASIDPACLNRAVALSNIATFAYTMLRPDEAGDLLDSKDADESEDTDLPLKRNKGKGRQSKVDPVFLKRVARRNDILLLAWKRFWQVVVPMGKRSSESALRLWLDFSTQIVLSFQVPSIGPDMYHEYTLPGPPPTLVQNLFSPSAVGRYGQWDISQDWDSQDVDEEKRSVEERWSTMARRRLDEIHSSQLGELLRKYPYDIFRQEMIAYIQHEVLAGPVNPMLTPTRRRLLINLPDQQTPTSAKKQLSFDHESSDDADTNNDETEVADWSDERGLSPEADNEDGEEGGIDLDLLMQIAQEMEAERTAEDVPKTRSHTKKRDASSSEEAEAEIPPGDISDSDNAPAANFGIEPEKSIGGEDAWAVRDYVPPTASAGPSTRVVRNDPGGQKGKFDWTARQPDAVQIEWESQSMEGDGTVERMQGGLDGLEDGEGAGEDMPSDDDDHEELLPRLSTSPTPALNANPAGNEMDGSVDDRPSQDHVHYPQSERVLPPTASRPNRGDGRSPPALRAARAPITPRKVGQKRRAFVTLTDEEDDEPVEVEESEGSVRSAESAEPELELRPPQSPAPLTLGEDEDELGDLLPDEQDFSRMLEDGDSGSDDHQDSYADDSRSDDEVNNLPRDQPPQPIGTATRNVPSAAPATGRQMSPALPTSQAAFISPRPRKSTEAHQFIRPDENEDIEDRNLLQPRSNARRLASSAPSMADRVANHDSKAEPLSPVVMNVHHFLQRVSVPPPVRKTPAAYVEDIRDDDDPFLYDEDGSPLDPDDLYVVPADYVAPKSKIHGRVNQSASIYCRLSGPRSWTKEEELLLYRTVQKVPYIEPFPLRLVEALHGEHGKVSQRLKWYNKQHMKDKMTSTVARRLNERRPVVGRARAWAKKGTREKIEYEKEKEEIQRMLEEEAEEAEGEDEDENNLSEGEAEPAGESEHENHGEEDDGTAGGSPGEESQNADEGRSAIDGQGVDHDQAVKEDVGRKTRGNALRKSTRLTRSTKGAESTVHDDASGSSSHELRSEASSEDEDDFPDPSSFRLDDAASANEDDDHGDESRSRRRRNASDKAQSRAKSSRRSDAQASPAVATKPRRSAQITSGAVDRDSQAETSKKSTRASRAKRTAKKRRSAEVSGSEGDSEDTQRPVKRATRSTRSVQRQTTQAGDTEAGMGAEAKAETEAEIRPRRGRGRPKGSKGKKKTTGRGRPRSTTGQQPMSGAKSKITAAGQSQRGEAGEGEIVPAPTPESGKVLVPSSSARTRRDEHGSDSEHVDVDEVGNEKGDADEDGQGQGHMDMGAANEGSGISSAHDGTAGQVDSVPDTYDQQANALAEDGNMDEDGANDRRYTANDNDNEDQDVVGHDEVDTNIHDNKNDNDNDSNNDRNLDGEKEKDDDDEFSERNLAKRREEIVRKVLGLQNHKGT
ncbi:hypothetical protein IAU59_000587 [Kwoniella sp. CBS 9459]